jgi:methionyl-tRNA synthetase
MIDRYRDGVVPEAEPDPALAGGPDGLSALEASVCELLDGSELTQALEAIWVRVRRLNRYVEENKPWELAKGEGDDARAELDRVLYNLAEGLRTVTLLLHAYMPETTDRLLEALSEGGRGLAAFGSRGGGQSIERVPPLFPKLEAVEGSGA